MARIKAGAWLTHLNRMTSLEWLYLYDTHVTDAGIAELKRALPKLRIYR